MFTGIIRDIGEVVWLRPKGKLLQYGIRTSLPKDSVAIGDSVAVEGVCQTVTSVREGELDFDAIDETLAKTTLKSIKKGMPVHLEPALRLDQGLDGHLVYGHVDGVATVTHIKRQEGRFDLTVEVPEGCERYMIDGGSICLAGISLTIFKTLGRQASVSLIPETLKSTRLQTITTGEALNVEMDVVGKWLDKFCSGQKLPASQNLLQKLESWG